MNKREDFKPGMVVFLSQYPVDSASFALVVDHDFWMDEIKKEVPTVSFYVLRSDVIPLRILGTRINVSWSTSKIEPNIKFVQHYAHENSGGHIEIVDLGATLKFLRMITSFEREISIKYFDEVIFELEVLKGYLNCEKFYVDLSSMGPFKVKFLNLLRRAVPREFKD